MSLGAGAMVAIVHPHSLRHAAAVVRAQPRAAQPHERVRPPAHPPHLSLAPVLKVAGAAPPPQSVLRIFYQVGRLSNIPRLLRLVVPELDSASQIYHGSIELIKYTGTSTIGCAPCPVAALIWIGRRGPEKGLSRKAGNDDNVSSLTYRMRSNMKHHRGRKMSHPRAERF
jgi:hypothetical protein